MMNSIKITKWGIILTLKNIGSFLASYTISQIKASPSEFWYAFLIYVLINVPGDLLIMNHVTSLGVKTKDERGT